MKKHLCLTLVILLVMSLFTSCDVIIEQTTPVPETTTPVTETTPPVTATTPAATETPAPLDGLAAELSGLWKRIDGSTATIPLTAALFDQFGSGVRPIHNKTPFAYENLIRKQADLIFVTYPSDDEFAMAEEQGVELEIIPIVKDALVFLVNVENPVDNIALEQLRDVYTGRITNWKQLGGLDEAIIPYQRSEGSGSQTLMLKLLMDGREPMSVPTEWKPTEMEGLVEVVSNYENAREAIGFSVFYYVNNMYGNSRFKLLGIDGVKPSWDTISRGEYPFEDYYYLDIPQNVGS